jgi:hypothetical protein
MLEFLVTERCERKNKIIITFQIKMMSKDVNNLSTEMSIIIDGALPSLVQDCLRV